MMANSAIAATTMSEPRTGAMMNEVPLRITMATPAGNRMPPAIWSQFRQGAVSGRRNELVIEPEHEQENTADQIEMRVRRRQREVLLNPHHDSRDHAERQNHNAYAHHQRSNHMPDPLLIGW